MPSIALSDPLSSPDLDLIKQKKKKSKKAEKLLLSEADDLSPEKMKKEKKKKKKEEEKTSKKRKVSSDEEERSETSSDMGEPIIKPTKKARASETDGELDDDEKVSDPNAVLNFRISAPLREALKSKGIEALFPIQAMTFNVILDGADLVGRARTGQGKTLAFVLPLLESLTNGRTKETRNTGYGRSPSVLVLLPTRELANQVYADFQDYGRVLGLSACCLYGGAPYGPQEGALRRGVDIVVGTPGRIKDFVEKGTLDLRSLKFRVLDEADQMLNMGFVDDVELILGKVDDLTKVQTLLFSATMPDWVKKIAARFLKPEKKTADLVGNEKLKASASVRHLVLPCSRKARSKLIPDLITCYSRGGRTIIFTETKESASELAGLLPGARALHGDIQQSTREVIIAGFRSGKFLVLVATNVAARGLDISDVQVVIQCEPPKDVEAYIHRSGRTGRAGNTGVAILLYERKDSYMISRIERDSGVKFEHISAPEPDDVAQTAGLEAAETITQVSDSVVPIFRSIAQELLTSSGLSDVDLLAKALANTAGYTEIKKRSMLSSLENYVTLLLKCGKLYTPSTAFSVFRRFLPEEKIEKVQGLSLTADGMGAVFDVPTNEVNAFLEGQENVTGVMIEVLKKLPPLQEREQSGGWRGGRGFSGGRGGGRGFSGGRGGGRGFSSSRGGGRFGQGRGGGCSSGNRFGRS
ncbi:DEAD-box ATP-dependent RNA helicase 7 [Acorus calamus]|uniref:RNA helicase n=1 Tax=Acorus calamus TaxID=4465 RepID=A0AAV9FM91_ACOCL|nr:DEAD-box ATP-dependent RNA helicase 7 [Acorus calamus]